MKRYATFVDTYGQTAGIFNVSHLISRVAYKCRVIMAHFRIKQGQANKVAPENLRKHPAEFLPLYEVMNIARPELKEKKTPSRSHSPQHTQKSLVEHQQHMQKKKHPFLNFQSATPTKDAELANPAKIADRVCEFKGTGESDKDCRVSESDRAICAHYH